MTHAFANQLCNYFSFHRSFTSKKQHRMNIHDTATSEDSQNAKEAWPMQTLYFHILTCYSQCTASGNRHEASSWLHAS